MRERTRFCHALQVHPVLMPLRYVASAPPRGSAARTGARGHHVLVVRAQAVLVCNTAPHAILLHWPCHLVTLGLGGHALVQLQRGHGVAAQQAQQDAARTRRQGPGLCRWDTSVWNGLAGRAGRDGGMLRESEGR